MLCEGCKELIVTIVSKGWAEEVIKASREAGAEGGTILMGRGTGIHETQSLMGIPIEPEKEIILTVVDPDLTKAVLEAICTSVDLETPGRWIELGVPLQLVAGRTHKFCRLDEGPKKQD
jgi:nitrogen regulatory protein PII